MNSSGALSALVKKTVEGLGYELVDVERLQRGLVRVTIDIERDGGISLEDCERVSDQLTDRKSTRLNSSHTDSSRMPSSA